MLSTRVLVLGAALVALVLLMSSLVALVRLTSSHPRKEGFNYTYTESVNATKKRGYTSWGRRLDVAKLCTAQGKCVLPDGEFVR